MVLHFDACTYVFQQEDGETNGLTLIFVDMCFSKKMEK
jgi:hypothetical protein